MRMASVLSSSAVSLANSFAIPASTSQRSPCALRSAALRVSSRAASRRVAMSASFSWIAWCSPMILPIVSRCMLYASAASKAARATPTARAAMLMRPTSSTPRIWGRPRPSSPTTLAAGMRWSVYAISTVSTPR